MQEYNPELALNTEVGFSYILTAGPLKYIN